MSYEIRKILIDYELLKNNLHQWKSFKMIKRRNINKIIGVGLKPSFMFCNNCNNRIL